MFGSKNVPAFVRSESRRVSVGGATTNSRTVLSEMRLPSDITKPAAVNATYSQSTNSHQATSFFVMTITELFAQNVRELRLERGFSQEELAHRAGLHRTYVGAVERGERNITLLNAQRIADALGVPLDRCVRLNNDKKKTQYSKRA